MNIVNNLNDVSSVTGMYRMFEEAYKFNQDISSGLLRPTPFVISKILV
jgi:hypothetical protein